MTESEVQRAIMRICKVDGHDSDFNVVGFYALCDRLKQIGAAEEREACARLCEELRDDWLRGRGRYEFMGEGADYCAEAIRGRGQE
jgi:hypothetical protein